MSTEQEREMLRRMYELGVDPDRSPLMHALLNTRPMAPPPPSSAMAGDAVTDKPSGATLHVTTVKNGFTVTCNGAVYVATDIDALHGIIKQALVEARLGV